MNSPHSIKALIFIFRRACLSGLWEQILVTDIMGLRASNRERRNYAVGFISVLSFKPKSNPAHIKEIMFSGKYILGTSIEKLRYLDIEYLSEIDEIISQEFELSMTIAIYLAKRLIEWSKKFYFVNLNPLTIINALCFAKLLRNGDKEALKGFVGEMNMKIDDELAEKISVLYDEFK